MSIDLFLRSRDDVVHEYRKSHLHIYRTHSLTYAKTVVPASWFITTIAAGGNAVVIVLVDDVVVVFVVVCLKSNGKSAAQERTIINPVSGLDIDSPRRS